MSARIGLRTAAWIALVLLGASGAGCANLEVKKVPLAERAAGADHEEGFRYYLNRPYIVVKRPISIVETQSIVRVRLNPTKDYKAPATPEGVGARDQVQLTFLSGARAGQQVPLKDLQVETPATGALRPVSVVELQKLSAALSSGSTTGDNPSTVPTDDQVVRADGHVMISDSGVNMIAATPSGVMRAGNTDGGTTNGSTDTNSTGGELAQPSLQAVQHTPPLVGDIAVLYLPDMDEQYAIKSCNFVSKSAFGLAFRNGGELVEVQGDHDSTAVPLAILSQVQKAIGAAQGVEQARIQQQAKSATASQTGGGRGLNVMLGYGGNESTWFLIQRTSIKPGVYRLNKPWEMEGHAIQPVGCGLLAKLGLPTVVEVDFKKYEDACKKQ